MIQNNSKVKECIEVYKFFLRCFKNMALKIKLNFDRCIIYVMQLSLVKYFIRANVYNMIERCKD